MQQQTEYSLRPSTSSDRNQILQFAVFWEGSSKLKYHQNRLSGFRDVGDRNRPFPLLWPLAYTTYCTYLSHLAAKMLLTVV